MTIKLSKPVTLFFLAAVCMALPEMFLVHSSHGLPTYPGQSSEVVTVMIMFCHMVALLFGLLGALAFKEYAEQDLSSHGDESQVAQVTPANIPVALPTLLDFEDHVINTRLAAIMVKSHEVKKLNILSDLLVENYFVENVEQQYLKEIWTNYIKLPKSLRESQEKLRNEVIHQFDLLEQGLASVEQTAFDYLNKKQEVHKRFLGHKLVDMRGGME